MQKRAGVYVRISRSFGDSLGVERQEADCRKLCAERGLDLLDLYVDNDVSAYGKKRRPEYERLMADVRAGLLDVIVCWHPDRLHRSPRELETFIDLVESHGVDVLTVTAGDRDLTTADGRFRARIEGAVARKESEDKSRRLRRKHEELAERGKVSGGGNRPFGFERDRKTLRPDEAEVIREVAGRVLGGESLYRVRNDLEARSVPTSTGAPWSTTALKTLLTNARTAGLRSHPRIGLTKAEWEPIISEGEWTQLVGLLNDASRRRNPVVRRYLLTRLIRCGRPECGEPLRAAPRSERKRGYGCVPRTGCGSVYALADPIEELVTEAALRLADLSDTRTRLTEERTRRTELTAELLTEARDAEEALDHLTRAHFVDRTVPARQFTAVSRELQTKIENARSRASAMQGDSVLEAHAGRVRDVWEDLDLEQRRQVITGVISDIQLMPWSPGRPRNRFDSERLVIVPRWATLQSIAELHAPSRSERKAAHDEYLRLNRQS